IRCGRESRPILRPRRPNPRERNTRKSRSRKNDVAVTTSRNPPGGCNPARFHLGVSACARVAAKLRFSQRPPYAARVMWSCLVLPIVLALAAPARTPESLDALARRYPADSLVAPLRRFEIERGTLREAGEAAMLLGRLHFARGEYRQAADAFARASARLDPSR